MKRRVSIADVARRAGLSPSTVSYALNRREDVPITAETRARVLDAARDLGYVANPVARALRTGRTNTVGLAVPSLTQPYGLELLQHLHAQVAGSGYRAMFTQGALPDGDDQEQRELLSVWPVDGIIAHAREPWYAALRATPTGRSLPLVMIASAPREGCDLVAYDLAPGTRDAVRHLWDQGCRRIVHLTPWFAVPTETRHRAYVETLTALGGTPEILSCADGDYAAGYAAMQAHLRDRGAPHGLFTYNDGLAIGACRALADAGVRVGAETAVVGLDGLTEDEYAVPRLSTVAIPLAEVAVCAWQLLHARLADPERPAETVTFTAQLVVRESSRRA
jgi:LacI family transcriptional regulator